VDHLPVFHLRHLAKGLPEIAVVENLDEREFVDGTVEVCQGAIKERGKFFGGHIMATLAHAHGDPLFGNLHRIEPDETEQDNVSGARGCTQNAYLFADGIGQDDFENETLPLPDQFLAQPVRQSGGFVGADTQFTSQVVGVMKRKPAGFRCVSKKVDFPAPFGPATAMMIGRASRGSITGIGSDGIPG